MRPPSGDIHHAHQAHTAPGPKRPSRVRRVITRGLGAALAVVLVAELALQLPPVREAIRSRAERALAAKWPGATIARCAAADVTGVVRFDGVHLPAAGRANVTLDGLEVAVKFGAMFRGKIELARVNAADTFVEVDIPRVGKIGIGGDGAKLALSVVELPGGDAPARVRLAGPSRGCLPSGPCLSADALIEAEASRESGEIRVRWQALLDDVRIRTADPDEPQVTLPPLAAHGGGSRIQGKASLDAEISVGPHGTVTVAATADAGKFRADIVAATASYAQLLASIPLGLPEEADLGVDGPLKGTAKIAGTIAQPDDWTVQAKLEMAKLRAHPGNAQAGRALVEPFLYRPNADPAAPATWMGTNNPDFLPLSETPQILIRSVLLSEDSFFFTHPGFDVEAMVGAMKTNLKEKRVRRGGSTLTQQLAKNLWLSRDRTLLRKLQEALLTITLEASVPKDRILEIYLNGIEWGPGIYGVKQASRHYFAKEPAALTPKEAAYLATVIPSPRKYYGYFRKGSLTPHWEERVMFLVGKLFGAGIIDEAQYEEAEWTPLRFASSGDDPWTQAVESATVAPIEPDD